MKKLILMMVACAITFQIHAQFQTIATNFGSTTNLIESVGIGDKPNGDHAARLHVNNFFCDDDQGAFNGYLFRTDGDDDVDNRWQMFTGTGATSQTERFRIRTLAGGYDTYLERTHSGSHYSKMTFWREMSIVGINLIDKHPPAAGPPIEYKLNTCYYRI